MRETENRESEDVELDKNIRDIYTDENGELQIHCKDFKVKYFFLDGKEGVLEDHIVEEFLGTFLEKEENKVKILSLISPLPNIYFLCVLATLAKFLSEFKKVTKNAVKQLEFEMLIMQIVRDSKKVEYLATPFIEHNRQIIDFEKMLEIGININLPFSKSLINTLIYNVNILNVKMINEIMKNMNYYNINEECVLKSELNEELKEKLEKYAKEKLHLRAQNILFKTKMIYDVIGILKYYLENGSKSASKVIFIFAEPVKSIIGDVRRLFSTNSNNIMIIYYTDPVYKADPPKIMKNIPSYVTILSRYYNRKIIPYGTDEYYHIKMLKEFENRIFEVSSELKDVVKQSEDSYCDLKWAHIKQLTERDETVKANALREIKEKYVEKQEKILEMENNGFLSIQKATLDQLKLLL